MRHKDSLTAQAMATAWRRQHHYPIGGQQHLGPPTSAQPGSPDRNVRLDQQTPTNKSGYVTEKNGPDR